MKLFKINLKMAEFKPLHRTKDAQAALMVLAPGQSSSDGVENEHPHAEQWLVVLSGSGRAIVGKRRLNLSLHSLLLIEKGEPHRIVNSGKSDLVTLNIYCPPAYSKEGTVLRSVAPG